MAFGIPGVDTSKQIAEFRRLLTEIRDLLREVRDLLREQSERDQ